MLLLGHQDVTGDPGTMDYVDLVVNGLFGVRALYFIAKDRKTASAE